jgi:Domain of unknown function (DUF4886)
MRVLFIGNSYTSFNELPEIFAQLAASAGHQVSAFSETSGGKSLQWHWYNSAAVSRIQAEKWDYVVLQDMSLQTVCDLELFHEYVDRFVSCIKAAGAQAVLYMTWARQHLPEMQEEISGAYQAAAQRTGAGLAPVGRAWDKYLKENSGAVLHVEDRSHPTFAGSYLAACVFFATIFKTDPTELTEQLKHSPGATVSLDPEMARVLRKCADQVVS